ncbi:MAG: type II toxin-antitoxin system VapC family toxin [Thermoleophilia bacterium]
MGGQNDQQNQTRDHARPIMTVFVDTSAWFEAFDAHSPLHDRVATALQASDGPAVTTTSVLAELVALMVGRLTHAHATRVGTFLRTSPDVDLVHPDVADESAAWRLFVERPDKRYSLTDCLSFVVMRRLKLTTALTLDRHFAQEGFEVLPAR